MLDGVCAIRNKVRQGLSILYGCYFFIQNIWESSANMVTSGQRPEGRESGKRVSNRFVFGYVVKFLRMKIISFRF